MPFRGFKPDECWANYHPFLEPSAKTVFLVHYQFYHEDLLLEFGVCTLPEMKVRMGVLLENAKKPLQ